MGTNENIRKYLNYLYDEGWSELICISHKERVKKELKENFPKMTEKEWEIIRSVIFWPPEKQEK